MQPKIRREFRSDIQALRTVAVLLVVAFHLWPKFVSGGYIGVDVFFVVSGYLITSHILRDVDANRFSVVRFWSRRVRRLIPASFTVLSFTAAGIVIFVPISLWGQWLADVIASIFYIENWVLAANAVDYLALENSASPSQHFWSLGVEEQFYLVWPMLVAVAILFAPKLNNSLRRKVIFSILSLVTLSSLAYGVYLTSGDPAVAYFSTPVRAWEFGVGALTAFLPSFAKKSWSTFLATLSFILLACIGLLYTAEIPFPGTAALLPVFATALVIWAAADSGYLAKILAFRPIQWIGDHSYSIYLWHWPLIILTPYMLEVENLSNKVKLTLIAATFILSAITVKFIERPLMSSGLRPELRPRAVFASLLLASVTISCLSWYAIDYSTKPIAREIDAANKLAETLPKCFGAQAMVLGEENCLNEKLVGVYPSIQAAGSDHGIDSSICSSVTRADWKPKECQIGKADSEVRIAIVGDSHIGHYRGAFTRMAKVNGWSVNVYAKGACPFSSSQRVHDEQLTESCRKWIIEVRKVLIERKYDLVVTSQASGVEWNVRQGETQKEVAEAGLVEVWSELVSHGVPVVAIKDNPRPVPKVLRCLELNSISKCTMEREEAFLYDPQVAAVEKMATPLVKLIDLDKYFCELDVCKPVIGHAIVYRDANHLTNTFALTLSPFIQPYVLAALSNQ